MTAVGAGSNRRNQATASSVLCFITGSTDRKGSKREQATQHPAKLIKSERRKSEEIWNENNA
jgi:hypothetical protein